MAIIDGIYQARKDLSLRIQSAIGPKSLHLEFSHARKRSRFHARHKFLHREVKGIAHRARNRFHPRALGLCLPMVEHLVD